MDFFSAMEKKAKGNTRSTVRQVSTRSVPSVESATATAKTAKDAVIKHGDLGDYAINNPIPSHKELVDTLLESDDYVQMDSYLTSMKAQYAKLMKAHMRAEHEKAKTAIIDEPAPKPAPKPSAEVSQDPLDTAIPSLIGAILAITEDYLSEGWVEPSDTLTGCMSALNGLASHVGGYSAKEHKFGTLFCEEGKVYDLVVVQVYNGEDETRLIKVQRQGGICLVLTPSTLPAAANVLNVTEWHDEESVIKFSERITTKVLGTMYTA